MQHVVPKYQKKFSHSLRWKHHWKFREVFCLLITSSCCCPFHCEPSLCEVNINRKRGRERKRWESVNRIMAVVDRTYLFFWLTEWLPCSQSCFASVNRNECASEFLRFSSQMEKSNIMWQGQRTSCSSRTHNDLKFVFEKIWLSTCDGSIIWDKQKQKT